jgi:hypothetical protein
MKIADFVKAQGLKFSVKAIAERPDSFGADMPRHFRCQIRKGRRSFVVYFSQGSGHNTEPTITDVLDCLASDIAGLQGAGSFEEWCGEYGYDTDSRRAFTTYKAIEKQEAALTRVINDSEAMNTLLYKIERE